MLCSALQCSQARKMSELMPDRLNMPQAAAAYSADRLAHLSRLWDIHSYHWCYKGGSRTRNYEMVGSKSDVKRVFWRLLFSGGARNLSFWAVALSSLSLPSSFPFPFQSPPIPCPVPSLPFPLSPFPFPPPSLPCLSFPSSPSLPLLLIPLPSISPSLPLLPPCREADPLNAGRLKMREWKMRYGQNCKVARVENAGVSRMERQPGIILRQP